MRAAGASAALLIAAMTMHPSAADTPPAAAYSHKGADTCLGCHDDPSLMGIFRTKHGRPTVPGAPFGHGGLQCEACHGPGDAHAKARGKTPAGIVDFRHTGISSVAVQNGQCLACHQTNVAHLWATTAHAAAGIACADCHTLHAAVDPVRQVATQPEVCGTCHEAQHSDLLKPYHHPLPEGKMACTSCHAPHGSSGPSNLLAETVTETCTTCHAEYRGPFLWEHQPVSEDCDNCHEPHGSVQPALLKVRPPFLCQQCHEGQGHPSAPMTPQGLAGGGMPNQFLLNGGCINCHSQIHGSNHPSGQDLMR